MGLFRAVSLKILAFCSLFATVMLGLTGATAAAQGSDRHGSIVADANNGTVLHADQADEPRFPASLTKIMTLYLAFEAIEQGRATYATRIKISQEAASQPPTSLDLDPGETIALIDAIKALVTKSANDVAVAIAEHFGGTESRFAAMMTDKARRFGMSRTTFRNASGLPDPAQVTTARDMLTLALRIQDDFPKHYHLFSTRSFTYDGSTYRNHNTLLHRFQGTDGIKTGYTRASGFNLVSSVRRGGRHVIGVVLGGRTASRRDDAMQMLVSRALMQSSPYKTRKTAPVLVAVARPIRRPEPARQAAITPVAPPRVAELPVPRPVMVPQRPRPAPQSAPVGMTSQPASSPLVPPAPELAVRRPSVLEGATLARATVTTPAGVGASTAAGGPARGTAPSTFQQQAALLSRASDGPVTSVRVAAARTMDPPYGVRGPMPPGGSEPIGSGFEIQIGAFATAAESDRMLANARASAAVLLQSHSARTVPVDKEARRIFRARFTGFDSRSAASTCLELRRRQIDCFVMRAE